MTEFKNPDRRKLARFDVAWVEKWENFKLPTLIFCSFFRNLSRISKEKDRKRKRKRKRPRISKEKDRQEKFLL